MRANRKNRSIAPVKKRELKLVKPEAKKEPEEKKEPEIKKADDTINSGLLKAIEGINQKLDVLIKKDTEVHKELGKNPEPDKKPDLEKKIEETPIEE